MSKPNPVLTSDPAKSDAQYWENRHLAALLEIHQLKQELAALRPGRTVPKRKLIVRINGKEHAVFEGKLSYERIVELAATRWGKKTLHTVVYSHRVPFKQLPGERSGTVVPGGAVDVTPRMVIDAFVT